MLTDDPSTALAIAEDAGRGVANCLANLIVTKNPTRRPSDTVTGTENAIATSIVGGTMTVSESTGTVSAATEIITILAAQHRDAIASTLLSTHTDICTYLSCQVLCGTINWI